MLSYDTHKAAFHVAEFCEWANISPAHFYREVRAGRIPVKKSGRRTLVLASDAVAWLEALPSADSKSAA